MLTVRKAEDRGHANHGWLDSYHSFSFANYYDPQHMGFRSLRVINEDMVAPAKGFPTHPHRDMEIITYVVSGAVAHKDSIGNTEKVGAGGVQRFSAGTGITHSEFNPSTTEGLHLLQIWLLPERQGITPSYEQKEFPAETKRNQWRAIANREATDGAVKLHQDAAIYATILEPGEQLTYTLQADRHAWVQIVQGEVTLNGTTLDKGDAAAISNETELAFAASTDAEILLFDLA
ncbi:pirin family protein [Leptolyngbya sp. FACHB-321]|uniref:pirin family protein n=1 Tax=Leptolyngbya sp. FACHB-321 TaxID=2692807 RepID=UPI001681DCBF|nr:pirin family protein [Leptolyngbya sp. FACHB-321]MBD2038632.1 pirin family protein [Leptolyngbya sp. FACHB-321]